MNRLVIFCLSSLCLTSCVTKRIGTISSSPASSNIRYEDMAYGVSQANKFLGIGGASKDALILEAKRNLMKNRTLKANEQYANFTLDLKTTTWIICGQTKVTLSADIISFTNDSNVYSNAYLEKLKTNQNQDLFSIGDSVMTSNFKRGAIINIAAGKASVLFKNESKVQTKRISLSKLFVLNKAYKDKKPGDHFAQTKMLSDGNEQIEVLTIEAIGIKSVIVRNWQKRLMVVRP